MKLTALEIKQQTFDKSIRGYDTAEVQAFLTLVSNEWEHLITRNQELEQEIQKLNDKLKHYEQVELALHETLHTAKESAEQRVEGAKKDAKNIIEKAEIEADSIVRDANQRRQQVRQSLLHLIDRREEMIGGIRSYLEIARESLEQFTKDEAALFRLPSSAPVRSAASQEQDQEQKPVPGNNKSITANNKPAEETEDNTHAPGHSDDKRKGEPSTMGDLDDMDDMDDILDQID